MFAPAWAQSSSSSHFLSIDHMPIGRVGNTGHLVAQRLQAIKVARAEPHWENAKNLESVNGGSSGLLSTEGTLAVHKSCKAELNVRNQQRTRASTSSQPAKTLPKKLTPRKPNHNSHNSAKGKGCDAPRPTKKDHGNSLGAWT